MGCGTDRLEGFINVDHFPGCNPDMVVDLEQTPWPWEDDSVEFVAFYNSLEHLGQETRVFLKMIQELYRICQEGAIVRIAVPHPRHDNFLNDPTHVRPITVPMLKLFDKTINQEWLAKGLANTPLAIQLGVDFSIIDYVYVLENSYKSAYESGAITNEDLADALEKHNNVASEIKIQLKVHKVSR
jgi:hypothetical protein